MDEIKFKSGDYIINRSAGDMAIYDKLDKKGYMTFKVYYGSMFNHIKDKSYTLQNRYQEFFELCNDEEKKQLDAILEDYAKNPEKYTFSLMRNS